ncbi:MAG: AAA family ATPase [Mycobacterium sp.]
MPRRALDTVMDLLTPNPGPEGGSTNGVALIGNEGVGKSTLAATAAERLGLGDPVWVIGTLTQQSVPFGAFGPLIEVHDVGKPAAMIRSAADSVLAQAGSAPIIVDNARLLDPLSASLVYHLAQEHTSPLIVTVRSVLQAPQVVTALWNDGLLRRLDVDALDGEETAALVAAAGGDEPVTLYRRSAGYPLHLRLLMTTGSSEETLTGAVDRYLGELSSPVREVLAHLCVFEPLSRDDLDAMTGAAVVDAAVAAGAVQVRGAGVYGGHPLFLERLAPVLDKTEVHRLRAAVANQLATRPSRTPADRLSRNLIAIHSDGPFDIDAVVAGAQEALLLGDLSLAERLAEGVLERSDRFDARLALSNALAWQGRGREADAALAAVDPAGLTEEQLMAWALPRAANQFWMLSEPERAVTFLQNVRGQVGTASSRITLDALSGTFAMNAGNVRRAVEIADEVLAQPDAPEMAVAWAGSAAALSSARMGRFADVEPLVHRALGSEYPGLLRFTVGLAQTTTQLMAGQTEAALETARGFTDFAEGAQPGRAIGEVLLAHVLLSIGDFEGAAELLKPAAAALERTGYSWGPLALTLLTTALAHQGEIAESAKALARAQARHGTKSGMFAPELGVARAWRLLTIGDRPAAITAARDAARTAQRGGQYAVAVRTWHEATRLGDRRAADAIAKIAGEADCAYTRMALAHARALTTGDAAGLLEAAEQLAAAGFHGAARDAAEQAQALSGAVT